MPKFSLYAKATGEIVGEAVAGPGVSFDTPEIGEADGEYAAQSHYIVAGVGADGPAMVGAARPVFTLNLSGGPLVADGVSFLTISGFPAGAEVSVDGGPFEAITGASIDFGADVAGSYRLAFRCWPYQPAELMLEATAP